MTPLNVLIEAKRRIALGVEDEYYTFDAVFPSHLGQINEIVAELKKMNAPKTLDLFSHIQDILSEVGESTIYYSVDEQLKELLSLPEQRVSAGFYFNENGEIVDIEKIDSSFKAMLTFNDSYPKVSISPEDGFIIGEFCYYVNELEVKLIQAGFTLKTYPDQEGDYFYTKSVKSNHAYADDNDIDLIEYVSPLSKCVGAGTLQISYLLDDRGTGDVADYKILVESDYGQELLERAGVK